MRRPTLAFLTRGGAWLVIALTLLASVTVLGGLRTDVPELAGQSAPADSESRRAAEIAAQFPGHDLAPVILLAQRDSGLTDSDLDFLNRATDRVAASAGSDAGRLTPSEDGRAAITTVMVEAELPSAQLAESIKELRAAARAEPSPEGLEFYLTGGPAYGADIVMAFDGADVTLLPVTLGIVAALLLLTYRSPILWLVPLTVVAVADQLAGVVSTWTAAQLGLQFDVGIVSVLVFGAGTNYALLMVSRYREELRSEPDHRIALSRAWRGSMPAILASNLTVVVALLTLVLATQPGSRGLGLTSAAGLLIALLSVAFALPAALSLVGRGVFWPFVPRPTADDVDHVARGPWYAVARAVTRRPALVLTAGVLLMGVLAAGLLGTRVGLAQTERFRTESESGTGLAVLAQHYPAGETAPLSLVVPTAETAAVVHAVAEIDGVLRASPVGETADDWQRVSVVIDADPGSQLASDGIIAVREAAHAVSPETLVGGAMAEDLDAAQAARQDLLTIAPLVLLVAFIVLMVLVRSLVAPLVLLGINTLSAVAAMGAGIWAGKVLFGFPALDPRVPLLSFLFLVALGIDYTIFLVHRARQEAVSHGTVVGIVRAVSSTGVVITSAGVVLAAVFAALGVLPLVTLAQLGLIVGLGVLLDTMLVRTVVVPAAFALIGDAMWWPGRRPVPRPSGSQ
ncbi:MMPL family transporter [Tessaracoccus sp. OS52]|uniref:MMPL family transporter n=1 Tax=Tessaracoccus sp. OS52 TaxID=2886691 RepID=UPI001D1291EF|nr:MMPL family transporter [Tessaracoccus sp. OS52]MCC2593946.1 MMPL family transporter [Tessaracoccus sp. OS52]